MVFDFLKRKKKDEPVEERKTPLDIVMQLKQDGLTNEQIVNQLRMQGYSLSQIKDALIQSDIKGGVAGVKEDAFRMMPESSSIKQEEPMSLESVPEPAVTSEPDPALVSSLKEWVDGGHDDSTIITEFENAGYSKNEVTKILEKIKSSEPLPQGSLLPTEQLPAQKPDATPSQGLEAPVNLSFQEHDPVTPKLLGQAQEPLPLESGPIPLPDPSVESSPLTEPTPQEPVPSDIEALIESVVQEKWNESMTSLDEMKKNVDELMNHMETTSSSVKELEKNQSSHVEKMDGSLSRIREKFDDSEARIDAFERLLKELLPDLFAKARMERPASKKAEDVEATKKLKSSEEDKPDLSIFEMSKEEAKPAIKESRPKKIRKIKRAKKKVAKKKKRVKKRKK